MADCYVGEIRMFAGTYAPEGWELCNGQTLPIQGNDMLFALIGTTYGGDGQSNFALPDMRGRVPISMGTSKAGNSYAIGQAGGTEKVTLTSDQMPAHTHAANAQSQPGTISSPTNMYWASTPVTAYHTNGVVTLSNMSSEAVSSVGQNLAHDNMMPFMPLSFIIATTGIFPSN